MSTETNDQKVTTVRPKAIEDYLNLNLETPGDIAKDLLTHVDDEARHEAIHLSDIVGPLPANLTPHMSGWYQTHIRAVRDMAFHAVNNLFIERADPRKGNEFLLEVKLGFLEETLLKDRLACYEKHAEQNRTTAQTIAELEARIARDEERYNRRKAELGRDGKPLNRPLYLFVLIVIIFGAEAALNLEAFEALPWSTPMIAWGATILVGMSIGFAAHFHGTLLKQFAHHFGSHVDDIKRGPAWRMFMAGSTLLSVSLAFVYIARAAYITALLGSIGGSGQAAEAPAFLSSVRGSLLGNLLVYLLGTFWAYVMHDSDPDLVDIKKGIDEARQHVEPLKQAMAIKRRREVEQLNAIHKKKVEEARRASELIPSQPALRLPLELFHKLQAKDADVIALLFRYRQMLIKKMGENAKNTTFVARADDPHLTTKNLTVSEFTSIPIKLKYSEEL